MLMDNFAPKTTTVLTEWRITTVTGVQVIVSLIVAKAKGSSFKMELTEVDVHCLQNVAEFA